MSTSPSPTYIHVAAVSPSMRSWRQFIASCVVWFAGAACDARKSEESLICFALITVSCCARRYVPKRRASSTAAPPQPAARPAAIDVGTISAASYMPEKHAWAEDMPLPVVDGSWHKADC